MGAVCLPYNLTDAAAHNVRQAFGRVLKHLGGGLPYIAGPFQRIDELEMAEAQSVEGVANLAGMLSGRLVTDHSE